MGIFMCCTKNDSKFSLIVGVFFGKYQHGILYLLNIDNLYIYIINLQKYVPILL